MDRNRLLITGLSVAIFLTAVVVFGLLWFYPQRESAEAADAMTDVQFDPFAYLDEEPSEIRSRDLPEFGDVPDEDLGEPDPLDLPEELIDAELTEVTEDGITIVFGSRERQRRIHPAPDHTEQTRETQPAPPDIRDMPDASVPAIEPSEPVRSPAPSEQSTRTAEPAREPAPATTRRTEPPAASQLEPRASQEYWVQVFAGSSRTNVEQAKDRFYQETTMQPLITTITHDDSVFYRLRVGPYHARQEAEELLGRLSGSSSFTESYISVVYN